MPSDKTTPFHLDLATVITEKDYGPNSLKVYYVNVANALEVEKDLIGVLAKLIRLTGCRLVCTEAAYGEVSRDLFKEYPPEQRKAIAMNYLNQGSLHAAHYLLLAGDEEFSLFGVDDPKAYARSMEIGKKVLDKRSLWRRLIGFDDNLPENSIRYDLLQQGPKSSALADFLRATVGIKVDTLVDHATRLGIELNPWIRPMQHVYELEAQIDFPRANEESSAISMELAKFLHQPESILTKSLKCIAPSGGTTPEALMAELHRSDATSFVDLTKRIQNTPLYKLVEYARRKQPDLKVPTSADELIAAYHTGLAQLRAEVQHRFAEQSPLEDESGDEVERSFQEINALKATGEFYQYLAELLVLLDLSPALYPNVIKYTQYCSYAANIDVFKSMPAVTMLRQEILDHLAEESDDREFLALIPRLELLAGLLTFQIRKEEVSQLDFDADLLEHSTLCDTLRRFIPDSAALREFSELKMEYEACYDNWMTWYGLQTSRAIKLADNTISCMLERGENQVILITGGFQREDVVSRFIQKRISHVVLAPIIRKAISEADMENYVSRLMGQTVDPLKNSNNERSTDDAD